MVLGLGLATLGRVEVRAVLGHVLHVLDRACEGSRLARRGRVLGSLLGLVERLLATIEVGHLLTIIGIAVVLVVSVSALGWHHPRKSNEGLQLRLLGVGDHEGVDASTIVASTIVASIVDAPIVDAPLIIFVGVS